MAGTAETIGVVLGELGSLAETVATVLGHSPIGAVVQIASMIFYDGADVAHSVSAAELAEIRRSRATGVAAGQDAYQESLQNFVRKCVACDASLHACNLAKATSDGGKCCVACQHPGPFR